TLLISPIYSMKEKTEEGKKKEERFIRIIRPEGEKKKFEKITLVTRDGHEIEVTEYQANQLGLVRGVLEDADPEDNPEVEITIKNITKKDLENLLSLVGKTKDSGHGLILYLLRDNITINAKDIEHLSDLFRTLKITDDDLIGMLKVAAYLDAKMLKVLLLALAYRPITKTLIAQRPIDEIIEIAMIRFALFPFSSKPEVVSALSFYVLKDDILKKYLDIKDNVDIIIPIFNDEGEAVDLKTYNLTKGDIARLKKMGLDTTKLEEKIMISRKKKDPFEGKRIIFVDEEEEKKEE
ncbi:hypothetical protein ACFLYA_02825, partial [Candidatus Dependentiae bacterium]